MIELRIATWFDRGLEAFRDMLMGIVGGDEDRFRNALRRNLERSAMTLVGRPTDYEGNLFTAACASLGAACHLLRVRPTPANWRQAYLAATAGQSVFGPPFPLAGSDPADAIKDELGQALLNAGFLGVQSTLDRHGQDVALRLGVHLLMRFLIAYAIRCDLATDPAVRRFRELLFAP